MNIDANEVIEHLTKQIGEYAKEVAILKTQVNKLNETISNCECKKE